MFCAAAAARRARIAAMPLITAPMPAAAVPSADTATHGSACGGGEGLGEGLQVAPVHTGFGPEAGSVKVPRRATKRTTARMPSSAATLRRIRARRFHASAAPTGPAGEESGGEVIGKS